MLAPAWPLARRRACMQRQPAAGGMLRAWDAPCAVNKLVRHLESKLKLVTDVQGALQGDVAACKEHIISGARAPSPGRHESASALAGLLTAALLAKPAAQARASRSPAWPSWSSRTRSARCVGGARLLSGCCQP